MTRQRKAPRFTLTRGGDRPPLSDIDRQYLDAMMPMIRLARELADERHQELAELLQEYESTVPPKLRVTKGEKRKR